jgi:hypothetical protein
MGHVMMRLSELRDHFAGRPAAVLGGGPSLPADMARLPAGCLLIAVNYHALFLGPVDFMVYNDTPDTDPELEKAVTAGQVTRVSPEPTSDVLFDVDIWTGFYSSNTAAWFALWLGCAPVILCGMDCYQGEQKYFHPTDRDVLPFHYPLYDHMRPWIEDGRRRLPHVERLRVMSGPLSQVFPLYEGAVAS